MAKRQYNSAADRKWQQRYQRILERRESVADFESPREERRREKKTLYRIENIDVQRVVPDKVAVICSSISQVRKLYLAIEKSSPEYCYWRSLSSIEDGYRYYVSEPAIGIITEDCGFFEATRIRVDSMSYFISKGFEIISFSDLLPVRDLGRVQRSTETVDFLLGV